ncbi:MAG TPA: hypothetical protein VHZ09_18330 [Acidobacteriaceae bacterium]|jgi:hypothetical protein|nr:hypothetical protein [Acidobacteriaceae bacterium]
MSTARLLVGELNLVVRHGKSNQKIDFLWDFLDLTGYGKSRILNAAQDSGRPSDVR